jgi:hypothetical protein
VINKGVNACPSGTIAAGWWRADGSPYCSSGTRYYIDCNERCCGPVRGDGFCAGCNACRCGTNCNTRKVYCNYFRYGQCNGGTRVGPIACRMVSCTPPYQLNIGCSPSGAVDNSTARHFRDCAPYKPPPPPPPLAAVLPMSAELKVDPSDVPHLFARFNDGSLRERRFESGAWTDWSVITTGITSGITAETYHGRFFVFARRGSNQPIWVSEWDGSSWSPMASLGGVLFSDPMAVVALDRLFVFAMGGSNILYYQRYDGTSWSGWKSLGGVETSTPMPVVLNDQIFVFIRGYERALWYQRATTAGWASAYRSLGGTTNADPTAAIHDGEIWALVRGDNNLLFYRRFNGSSWDGGYSVAGNAGTFASDPVAISHAGQLWVFTRSSAGELRYGTHNGTEWSAWQTLDTGIDCDPAVSVMNGTLYVAADSTASTSHLWTHDGTQWSALQDLGGPTAPFRAR